MKNLEEMYPQGEKVMVSCFNMLTCKFSQPVYLLTLLIDQIG